MSQLDNEIIEFRDSMGKVVQMVKGDENTDIQTPNGPIPTLAKQAKAVRNVIETLVPDLANRLRVDAKGNYTEEQKAIARANLGLDKVDNTPDSVKPASQQTLNAINNFADAISSRENPINKNQSNGYVGLSGLRLMVRNLANTFTGFLTTESTAARTWTLPDNSGILALKSDITGANSNTNTGDETKSTILAKLQVAGLSGVNTGDETKESLLAKIGASTLTGTNTGDETGATILAKLNINEISGRNTGDETRSTIVSKIGYEVVNAATLDAAGGVATLGLDRKISADRLPDTVRNFIKVANLSALPNPGNANAIYVTADTRRMYYWDQNTYQDLGWAVSNTNELTEGSNNLYFTQARVRASTLTGLVTTNRNAIVATDQAITAFGKLQGQINALTVDGGGGIVTLVGDVTGSGAGEITVTIADYAVSLKKLAAIPTGFMLGRAAAGTGDVQLLDSATMRSLLLLNNVNNTADSVKEVSGPQQAALNGKEDKTNKVVNFGTPNDTTYPTTKAVKAYVENLVSGLIKDCGNYDASTNAWPSTGGTGDAGAILKGNFWYISAPGTLGGVPVDVGDSLRALADNPGQVNTNWAVLEGSIGYVPYNSTNPAGYTANKTDAFLLNRDNHTGSQSASTIVETSDKVFVTPALKTSITHSNRAALDLVTGTNTGDQTIALTGDITGSGKGSFVATIANRAVSFDKFAAVPTAVLLGRTTAGSGNVEVLNATAVKTFLGLENVSNTTDNNKPVSAATSSELDKKESHGNKATNFSVANNILYPTTLAAKEYIDGRTSSMWKDCGLHNASTNLFPESGGTGALGVPSAGNIWTITTAGTLGGKAVGVGDTARALIEGPGQTAANWAINQSTFGYTPFNKAGDTLTGAMKVANGQNLAVATTLNLTSSTGNITEVTGNNIAISAITLVLGDVKVVRFAGTGNTLVYSATALRLPSQRNIRVQPGDYAIFVGKNNGAGAVVVDCVSYVRANGTAIQSSNIEKVRTIAATTAATAVSLDNNDGCTVYKVTVGANTTVTFDNLPNLIAGEIFSFTLILANDATAGRAVSFGNTIEWADGMIPPRTTAANAVDVWTFYYDGTVFSGSLSIVNKK